MATTTATATKARTSRLALLESIARDLLPAWLKDDVEVDLRDEELRSIDRAFAAWPVRYSTPTMILFTPVSDCNDEPQISFHWNSWCDGWMHDDVVCFNVFTDDEGNVEDLFAENVEGMPIEKDELEKVES